MRPRQWRRRLRPAERGEAIEPGAGAQQPVLKRAALAQRVHQAGQPGPSGECNSLFIERAVSMGPFPSVSVLPLTRPFPCATRPCDERVFMISGKVNKPQLFSVRDCRAHESVRGLSMPTWQRIYVRCAHGCAPRAARAPARGRNWGLRLKFLQNLHTRQRDNTTFHIIITPAVSH